MMSIKKFFNEYGFAGIFIFIVALYGLFMLVKYLASKGAFGLETAQTMPSQYSSTSSPNGNVSTVQPSDGLGQDETYASVSGIQTSMPVMPASCSPATITDPSELLPKDKNSQWAELNPSGKGELSNVNLLRAGYNIGIDTIGGSLRNGNQQIRSDPVCPQYDVGPWNQSTITPNFMRPPLEIGAGAQ